MLVISLVEEIIFRGYIQTRLYGLIKRPLFAIILGGILFMLMHIPFQIGYAKMGLFAYIQVNYITLMFTFIWHVVFDFLYRKYNTIYASTIFHGLMDWANYLFIV
ncbi:CPBP family intramembrane glutamic endopeptidase [Desulfitobacterium dichloroeliminans]